MSPRRHRAVATVVLAVVGLLLASCQSSAAEPRPVPIGMGVHMLYDDPAAVGRQFDLMKQMKVSWVRVDFDWSAIETERGHYDWSYPDRMVTEATARGMQVLALLTYTPNWARPPGTTSHAPPDSDADFAQFASAAAGRYSPRGVHSWEIWNEPNISGFWEPRPDVDRYGTLLRAAADAIRGIDRAATLITGGLTRGTDTPDGLRISQTTFVEGLYANGAAQHADAIAVHPYSFPFLPASSDLVGGYADLPRIHDVTRRNDDGGKKIWITEFGAPTGTAAEAMSEADQKMSVQQARSMAESWNWAGPLIYYELRDSGTDPADLEQNFGVLRADLSPKDAATALMTSATRAP